MIKKKLLSLRVHTGTYGDFIDRLIDLAQTREGGYTCIANVHMLVEAYNDPQFADIVNNADVITPDGKPLTWAMRLLHGIRQDRVAGMDLLPDVLKRAEGENLSVYFYGGSEELLNSTKAYIAREYPALHTAGFYSPPFRTLTREEEELADHNINQSGAHLLFVVLGCPKQEKWMAARRGRINAAMVGIGGALPVMVGIQGRAPGWMQHAGLEWLYRLGQEPGRLFKRYAVTNSTFIYVLLKEYLHIKIGRKLAWAFAAVITYL